MEGAMRMEDFNCTIQELKRAKLTKKEMTDCNFNCTIQELKHVRRIVFIVFN